MAGTNKIYPFGAGANPPYIQTDAEYEADSMRADGWQPGVVRQEFLNKVDRQGNSMASGLGQFIADNILGTDDIVDTLTPNDVSALMTEAISYMSLETAPQFDNSKRPADTEFVNRALGSLSGDSDYGTSSVLSASAVGEIISPTAAGITFTLPLAASVRNGSKIYFNGNTHGAIIQAQGPDTISSGTGGNLTFVTLLGDDIGELTVIDGKWYVTGGELHQNYSSSFAHSKTTNGYIKLPGGVIFQWGRAVIPAAVTTINFSIPFPTACVNINATDYGSGCLNVAAVSVDNSSFHAVARISSSGTFSNCDYNWFAVGY